MSFGGESTRDEVEERSDLGFLSGRYNIIEGFMSQEKRRVNILHVTFNMGVGGTEQVITQLIQGANHERFRQEVVCIDGEIGTMGQILMDRGFSVSMLQRRPGIDLALAWALRRLIRERDIQIVHCHQYTPYFYSWMAGRLTGARIIFTEHGRFHPDRYRTKAKWLNRLMAASTEAIVAISHATADALAKYEYIPRRCIQVIYNGIAEKSVAVSETRAMATQLGISENARVLCMVSRLDSIKNHNMALKAFRSVQDRFDNLILLIVGDGPERTGIENQIRDLGIANNVRLVGYSGSPEQYMALADLYLLTSYSEGTSMTLLEAMSLGVAPVVTNVGGNPEIVVDGANGCLVSNDDANMLAETLTWLLDRPNEIARLGQAARQAFEDQFSVATMVSHYHNLYTRCADASS